MKLLVCLFLLVIINACSSTPSTRILPGESEHTVEVRHQYRDQAEQIASSEAEEYCKSKGKTALIRSTDTFYTGTSMDESTRNTTRTVSQVGLGVAGIEAVRGNKDTAYAAAAASAAGLAATSGNDYLAVIKFVCDFESPSGYRRF